MQIEQALYQALAGTPSLAGLVGDRIYPEAAPQGAAMPYLVYYQGHRQQVRNLAGERVNLNSYTCALEASARSYASAKGVYLALREAILDLRGPIADGSCIVHGLFEENGGDRHTPPIHADQKGIYHADLEVSLGYSST